MKILVVSDTHGDFKNLYKVVKSEPDVDIIIHLGDGSKDLKKIGNSLEDKIILQVRGNCDVFSTLPEILEETVSNKKILITHGNLFAVKKNLDLIIDHAVNKNVNIVLFGHTHKSINIKHGGLHIMNPGSLYGINGTYGIINIENDSISGIIKKVSDIT